MSDCVSSSITHYLDALPLHTFIIGSDGVIFFVSSSWTAYSNDYELFSLDGDVGGNYFELLHEWITDLNVMENLRTSVQSIAQGKSLLYHIEFRINTPNKGCRNIQLNTLPLMTGYNMDLFKLVVSLKDLGPAAEDCLIPICASCKSIRNPMEDWLPIEHYLQQIHSVQFTHDICPDCIRQLYPKYAGAFNGSSEI